MLRYAVRLYVGVKVIACFMFDDEESALEFAKAAKVYYFPETPDDEFVVLIDVIKEDINNGN